MQVNAILAGIAAVLAIPTALTLLNEGSEFIDYSERPKMFPGFTKDQVAILAITKPKTDADPPAPNAPAQAGPDIVLQKQDGKWVFRQGNLTGAPCQDYPIDQVLDPIADIPADKESIIIADAKDEDLATAGLNTAEAIRVDCYAADGVELAQFFVGKESSGGKYGQDVVQGRYVRRVAGKKDDGRKSVVLFEKEFWNLSTSEDEFVDKQVHEFDAADAKKFTVRNPKGNMAFEREGENATQWKRTAGPEGLGAVRQAEVDNLLARFVAMSAESFVKPLQAVPSAELMQHGLVPRPAYEVSVELKDGKRHVMTIGRKIDDKNAYWAKFEGFAFLCTVGDWVVSSFEKDPKDFFDPAAPAPDPEKDQPKPGAKKGDGEKSGAGNGGGQPPPGGGKPDENPAKTKGGAGKGGP